MSHYLKTCGEAALRFMAVDIHQTVNRQPSERVVEANSDCRGQRPNLFKSVEESFLMIYMEGLKENYIFYSSSATGQATCWVRY